MQKVSIYFSKLNRQKKTILLITLDIISLTASFLVAVLIRPESLDFVRQLPILGALFSSVLTALLVFWVLGLYQIVVRFLTGKVLVVISKGVMVAGISLYFAGLFFDANLPWSAPLVFTVLAFLSIGGIRFAVREFLRTPKNLNKRPIIIYGAGEAGRQLLNALFHGNEFSPVAIVDDDLSLHNMNIGGFRVFSPEKIPHLAQTTGAQVILLAMPLMSRYRRRQIVSSMGDFGLEIKTIPSMSDIISGKTKISRLRTVSAEDLLGRDPVAPEPELIGQDITGRVVMVSGAGERSGVNSAARS